MRKVLILFTALAFLLVAMTAAAAKTPTTVTLDDAKAKQPAVVFPHDKHVKAVKTCDTCHHTNKGATVAKEAEVKGCTACHLTPKEKGAESIKEMSLTKNPFHVKCVGCHKTDAKAKAAKAPVVCKDCHKK